VKKFWNFLIGCTGSEQMKVALIMMFVCVFVITLCTWLVVLRRSVRTLASEWTTERGLQMSKDIVSGWVVKVTVQSLCRR